MQDNTVQIRKATKAQLLEEVDELHARLRKAEEALTAMRSGAADACSGTAGTNRPRYGNTIRDITERQQIEELLQWQVSEVRSLIDHLPDIIARFDRDLRCTFVSPHIRDIFGVTPSACIGKTVRETGIFDDETLCRFKAHSQQAFTAGRPETLEFSFPGPSKTQYFSVRFIPELGADRNITSLLSIMEDVTERKQVEMELEERTAQLEIANKELESFSYSVSHDLRAPLRAIDGYSRMLLRQHEGQINQDVKDKIEVIRRNTRMMGQLIDDLLSFSRVIRKDMKVSEINMEGLAREVWQEIQAANREREMEVRITNVLPGLGDPFLVKQVLTNLLSNAVKFTRDRKPASIELSSYLNDTEVIYSVKDNGVGFDMHYYQKLFGVFQRLHRDDEFEGTGVGLAIVQRIINRLGGRVWAEGKIEEGATFYFALPSRPD